MLFHRVARPIGNREMANRSDVLAALELLIACARQSPRQQKFESIGQTLPENPEPIDRLQQFSQAILAGALPDPETLMFLAESMYDYVDAAGEKSLDEAFRLRAVPKSGNPSKKRFQRDQRRSLLFDMACARADDPTLSLEQAAEKIGVDPEQVDTIVRDYRRQRFRDWESSIPPLSPEHTGK